MIRWAAYTLISLLAFITATMGSDVFARTRIAGETLRQALFDHLHWATIQWVSTALLFAPFLAVAFVCAAVQKYARTRSVAAIFACSLTALLYFYFQGYQGAQRAAAEEHWTAATLAVGLLPFLIGIPVVTMVAMAAIPAVFLDRRRAE